MTVLIIFAVLLASIIIVSNVIEFVDYNRGICPHCGKELEWTIGGRHRGSFFENRLYVCPDCDYYTYVSWHWMCKKRHKKK